MCAHVCVCVCVDTKQEIFIFQWHFAKETSNSISYCKERNLHFIITFLHEKMAEPLALVHIGRNGRFQASRIQGRPWQFIPFHHLRSPIQYMLSSSKSIPCYEICIKASKVSQARGGSWVLMAFCLETPSSITLDQNFKCMPFSLETEENCEIILVMSQELKQSSIPCLLYWMHPNWRIFCKENFCSWIMSSCR